MKLEITIKEKSIKHFSDGAKKNLIAHTKKRANVLIENLISETLRVEAGHRRNGRTPEISASDVDSAAQITDLTQGFTTRTKKHRILHVALAVTSVVAGKLIILDNKICLVIASALLVFVAYTSWILYNKD